MHRRSIQIVTAAALSALAGQAVAQQQLSPAEGRRIGQKLQESDKSLTDAIQLAERETGGKALAAEIMTSSDLQRILGRPQGERPGGDIRRPSDEAQRQRERETNPGQDQDRQQQNRDRLTGGQKGLHASVIILANDTELRRVIVDLEEGRVVQSHAMGAGSGAEGDRLTRQGLSASDGGQMRLASKVINTDVVNAQDDDLGDIDDLALDVTSGRVRYAVVKTGGLLGMGGDRHAVPLGALTFVGKDEVRLNVTKDELEQREGFDTDRWPQQPTGAWGGAGQQDQQPGRRTQPDREGQQPQVQRPGGQQDQQQMSSTVEKASDVIGATVHGPGDATVGDIDDIVIKPSDSSIVRYVIATDDGKVAVPASGIKM